MGRHTAPVPIVQSAARPPLQDLHGSQPSTLPVITVAMLRPAVAEVARTEPAAQQTSVHRQQIALLERSERIQSPDAVPAPPRAAVLTIDARPIRTADRPTTEPVRLVAPELGAHSLITGPITVHPRRASRRPVRAARLAVAVAAIAIAGTIATQLTTQRSEADVSGVLLGATTGAAANSPAPSSSTHRATGTAAAASSSSASSSAGPTRGRLSPTASGSASTARATTTDASSSPSSSSAAAASASSTASASTSPSSRSTTPTNARSLSTALAASRELAAGLFRFSDFGGDLLGMDLTGRLTGAGSSSTILEMTPMSSSKSAKVPTRAWTTNQLSLIRISQASVISGFTLQGTKQGHLYNGLRISRSTNPRISDVKVVAVPGDDDIPPGETFGINDFHTSGAKYSDVEVDGNGVSGATFGTNNSNDVSISDSSFHDAGHSNGATFWQTKNVTVKNTTSVDNYDAAFNFERVSGTVLLDHVTMRGNRLSDLRINSDKASAVYRIVDPVLDGGKVTIVMTPKYMGHKNVQKKSDVHVIVHGVDRTDDLLKWVDHF